MKLRKVARFASVGFLVIGFIFSTALLLFSIGMEGMRHSQPGPSQFDSYYWISGLPVGLSLYWLVSAFIRISKKSTIALTIIAAILSFWWLALAIEEGVEIAAVAAAFVVLSFFASWYFRSSARFESHESQTA